MKPTAFTLRSNTGILNVIKSVCGISLPFDPNKSKPHPKIYEFNAIWDTGATNTVITSDVVKRLGLIPIGKIRSFNAAGSVMVNQYTINIFLPNQVVFHFIKVSEGVLNGTDVLIGMDIIAAGDFSITNVGGNTTFSFRVPSIVDVDFVKEANNPPDKTIKLPVKIGRNSPCECGSGKKYKQCCGKL